VPSTIAWVVPGLACPTWHGRRSQGSEGANATAPAAPTTILKDFKPCNRGDAWLNGIETLVDRRVRCMWPSVDHSCSLRHLWPASQAGGGTTSGWLCADRKSS